LGGALRKAWRAGEFGERQGAVGTGAVGQVVVAGSHDLGQRLADHGRIGELGVDLGELVDRALVQAAAGVAAVAAGVEQLERSPPGWP